LSVESLPQICATTILQRVTAIRVHGRIGKSNTSWTSFAVTSRESLGPPLRKRLTAASKRSKLPLGERDLSTAQGESYRTELPTD
jgi:hypothetical protein